ncbi:response regulator [Rhabdochromatium marinum]|uniref:response regulator n=1 Tax=Rhabdochromatium marinum TaxID=48729 RepID=UPI0019084BD3
MQVALADAAEDTDARLEFRIADTGVGISADQIEAIFQPFFQISAGSSRSHQGVGLGLSIVRRLLDLMQGRVSIDSTVGVGTTFRFSIPLQVVDAASTIQVVADVPRPVASAPPQPAAGANILLVDDEPVNLILARRILEKHQHQVRCASNGQEALNALRDQDCDLVLMDIQMPGMDGLEATRLIREGAAGAHHVRLPIVAMTAHAMAGDKERFLAAGIDRYLTKPFVIDDLLGLFNRLWKKAENE